MKLRDLLNASNPAPSPALDLVVSAVTEDSRRVQPGTVFFAFQGGRTDGHDYIEAAAKAGAVAVVGDRANASRTVPYIRVDNPRRALGLAAHALAGNPTQSMTVVGVTGTNGKSSTVALIRAILEHAGNPTATFGTLGYTIGAESIVAPQTTPSAEELAAMFRKALDAGIAHAAMEVSSHALEQDRAAGIVFTAGVFTNLTQDHLDYHLDMEQYFESKCRLMDCIAGPGGFMVINSDDEYGRRMRKLAPVPVLTFGRSGDCRATDIALSAASTRFRLSTPWGEGNVETRLLGRHNVANILAAVTACGGLGLPFEALVEGTMGIHAVPGRFEQIDCGQNFAVVVDYAHTDDGLRNVLEAARAITKGRVICVFGCGGDRDRTKRPKMARAAAELADYAIVTSDNPRTEDPTRIVLDVESGMQHAGKRKDDDYLVIVDRATAIAKAFELARAGDFVMIAGKGHEDYQIIGTERIHFDDREVARALLQESSKA
jgi:UDP-N-acetylmuramoyl-L-alanyl-D-glutamate--2,6-diaminopimelate ligase